jgi:hypothetical protein
LRNNKKTNDYLEEDPDITICYRCEENYDLNENKECVLRDLPAKCSGNKALF